MREKWKYFLVASKILSEIQEHSRVLSLRNYRTEGHSGLLNNNVHDLRGKPKSTQKDIDFGAEWRKLTLMYIFVSCIHVSSIYVSK